MIYHVTDIQSGVEIWEEDRLKSSSDINEKRNVRAEMRRNLDQVGQEMYADWVFRKSSVFGWPSFEKATQYANRYLEPAIVTFDCAGPVWCVESHKIEEFYTEYIENSSESSAVELVESARKWNGEINSEIELWFNPSNVTQIYEVTDEFGNPIQEEGT